MMLAIIGQLQGWLDADSPTRGPNPSFRDGLRCQRGINLACLESIMHIEMVRKKIVAIVSKWHHVVAENCSFPQASQADLTRIIVKRIDHIFLDKDIGTT